MNFTDKSKVILKSLGFPSKHVVSKWSNREIEDFFPIIHLYKAWAAYAKGNFGETYVCDSDNAPA